MGDRDSQKCEDVSSPPLQPPSTLLPVLLSCGRLNVLCNDVTEHGNDGPGLIDHCNEMSSSSYSLSSSVAELSYCGHNDLCSDMVEHGNDVIKRSTPCSGVSPF